MGDSFIHWASRVALSSPWGEALDGMATVRWLGRRGLRLDQFNDFLHSCWTKEPESPTWIIIHVGSNDLGYVPKKSMFEGIKQILAVTRELLPHSIIYWSEILPKVSYPSANKQNSVERTRRALNRSVGNLFLRAPGGLIAHPQIAWWRQEFYLPDGVHLVDAASQFLIYNFHITLIRSCEVA